MIDLTMEFKFQLKSWNVFSLEWKESIVSGLDLWSSTALHSAIRSCWPWVFIGQVLVHVLYLVTQLFVLVFLIYIKTIKKITLTSRCHDNLSGIAVRITSQLLPLLQIWSILVPQIQDGQYVNVLIINNFLCLRQLIEQNKTYDGITSCFFSSPIDNLNK